MKLRKRLVRPCKYIILRILKFRFRTRLYVKFLKRKQSPPQRQINDENSPRRRTKKVLSFRSVLRLLRIRKKKRDIECMDRMMELKSLSGSTAAVENQEKSCVRTRSKISTTTTTTTSTNYVTDGSENREKSCLLATGRSTSSANVGRDECAEVEEACRSFENYLVEMITEEGQMKDLMDVEQLLYCWNNLRCPVFIGLVSTFYRELCKDLFSDN